MKRITIVTPVFNEEETLPAFSETITRVVLDKNNYDYHVLLVDDGSTDRSWEMIRSICRTNPKFQGIRLSRNFGANIADTAGLSVAEGDAVVVLACDLQDPPEVVHQFLDKWEQGAKIVWGKRRSRQDENWRIFSSQLFYKSMKKMALPQDSKFTTGGFFLADRKVIDCFKQFPERNRIVFALIAWTGFEQAVVEYDRARRVAGVSAWTRAKMIKSMYDGLIGFSSVPVRMITLIGIVIFLLTIPMSAYLIYCKFTGSPQVGWTGIMLLVTLLFGAQFLLIGLVGEYLHRIYIEVVQRPLFFISEKIGV